jgi:hypothetical protein
MNRRMLSAVGPAIGGALVLGGLVVLCHGFLADSTVLGADEPAAQRAADLAPPVLVMAGGKPIDVDGYAAPFVGDFDGDGKNDLLVGQYVYGKLRIYRNVGTNAEPKFDGFEWFTVDGLPACVPAGCHVGFTPQLVDFDGDGRTDVLTGSFPGVHFLFRRNRDGTFAQAEVLRDKHGEIQFGYPQRRRYNSTVFVHDWDQDGKPDLLLGRGTFSLVPNEGSRRQPVFGDAAPLNLNSVRIYGGNVGPCVADWDGDGRDDLIIGRGGHIVWYRNIGEKGRPVLAASQILVPDNRGSGYGEEPAGSEPRLFRAVCVADFNGDGRLDLLLGDTYTVANELPEPNDAQRAKDEETGNMKKHLWSEWSRLTADRPQGEAVQEHDAQWKKALRALQEVAARDPDGTQSSGNLRSKRHGRVWLYARTAASGRNP